MLGVLARVTAFPFDSGAIPHPSSTKSTTGLMSQADSFAFFKNENITYRSFYLFHRFNIKIENTAYGLPVAGPKRWAASPSIIRLICAAESSYG